VKAIAFIIAALVASIALADDADRAATTRAIDLGPDVVILNQLVDRYQPVPFDHRGHATMAQMWNGCTTCHHRKPTTRPTTQSMAAEHVQASSDEIPACKTCHSVAEHEANIQMPSLKGAYHRQCLNCHKQWTHENACVMCHAPIDRTTPATIAATTRPASPDDIVGRMHPPIPEPEEKSYAARFEPAPGRNVLFRHAEHVKGFGITCATCHRDDSCSTCHDGNGDRPQVMKPSKTWRQSHAACVTCHEQDRCQHCHYKDGETPPPPFDHRVTGQSMDDDHAKLACVKCHALLKTNVDPTCGDAKCHGKSDRPIVFPNDRPGPIVATTQPARTIRAAMIAQEILSVPSATQPATKPTVLRIRK
jgi:hypothetical protein